jgi:Xaa-Pro dipeptidase
MSGERIRRFSEVLQSEGVDAFFGHSPITMGYLHGVHEHGGERFLTLAVRATGEVHMICPALSESQARRAGVKEVSSWRDGEDPMPLFVRLADAWDLRSGILAVDDDMPAQMLLKMQAALPTALFKPAQPLVSQLMRSKEPGELDLMRQAARIADEAWVEVRPKIQVGQSERQVAAMLYEAMAGRGGEPTFAIVATGAGSAEPHHLSDDTPLRDGDVVVIDFGCKVGGYNSDITRTVALGDPGDEARRVYDVVLEAHQAGREAARAGVECQAVDRAARRVIEAAGYGEFFVHRTGHGIGMRGHEEPFVVEGNDEALVSGNCFSVEPGIYLPGRFGVRIENIVAATEDGFESLNAEPEARLTQL